ncbi:hypothetical protein BKA93DRAFT_734305, partial [Sparassis latifolia]
QIAPVVPGDGPVPALHASIKLSHLWHHFNIFSVTTTVRSAEDSEYTSFVDTISEDTSGNEVFLEIIQNVANIDQAIDFLFPPHVLDDPIECLNHAFLSPKNVVVDELNAAMLDMLSGEHCKCHTPYHPFTVLLLLNSSHLLQF